MAALLLFACAFAASVTVEASHSRCTVGDVVGCFVDGGDADRDLARQVSVEANSLENCASACFDAGFTDPNAVFGVEFGTQCFCGASGFAPGHTPQPVPAPSSADCEAMPCPGSHPLPGEKQEHCGGANRLLAFKANCTKGADAPNFAPCYKGSPGEHMPFCDASGAVSVAERVADLISRMSLPQKVRLSLSPLSSLSLCLPSTHLPDRISRMSLSQKCAQVDDKMGAMPEVGWQGYNWNTECLHGLGAICLQDPTGKTNDTRCPSVFAAPPLLGATFNTTVAWQLGDVISDEIRAFGNSGGHRDYQGRGIGVSAWGPNLNIYRGKSPGSTQFSAPSNRHTH